jgi:hypothetical protein
MRAVVFCGLLACGGTIFEDPAGGPDPRHPRPAGSPGSLCAAWTALPIDPPPSCESTFPSGCDEWSARFSPPGLSLGGGYCWKENGEAAMCKGGHARASGVLCRQGPAGNAYCRTVYEEAVIGGGTVPAFCGNLGFSCDPDHPPLPPPQLCEPRAGACALLWGEGTKPLCEPGYLPVDRGKGIQCERPCTVPP